MKFDVLPISALGPEWKSLIEAAKKVQSHAYAPYSGFQVASALEDEHGRVHVGVNVENSNYGGTLCAERNAITRMIADGGKQIKRIVVLTPTQEPNFPCGACLQSLQEFQADTVVVGINQNGSRFAQASLRELFPAPFTTDRLERGKKK